MVLPQLFVDPFRLRTTISVPHRVVSACQILGADKGYDIAANMRCAKSTHILGKVWNTNLRIER